MSDLTITQEDREAALALMRRVRGFAVGLPDDGHFAIQAFAKHRLQSEARVARYKEALEEACGLMRELTEPDMNVSAINIYARLRAAELRARTALGGPND